MKSLKVAVALALAAAFGTAQAFHDGGVARCSGCHTMHNSVTTATGATNTIATVSGSTTIGTVNAYLLKGATPSDTCLNCHAGTGAGSGYRILDNNGTGPAVSTSSFTPGGDFVWVKEGNRKGHNVEAAFFGLNADSRQKPPGYTGAWTGAGFSCVSCHDPHGQSRQLEGTGAWSRSGAPIEGSSSYVSFEGVVGGVPTTGNAWGSYRILGSNGWVSRAGGIAFPASTNPPVAVAPNTYNKSEDGFTQAGGSGQTVVAYVSGMSEWCVTCHPAMHQVGALGFGSNLRHPSSNTAFLGALATNYNNYVKTGDLSGGGDAYDAFVPFEIQGLREDAVQYAASVGDDTALAADANSTVMCLSCHRAHASGFDSMLRFSIADAFVGEWTLTKDIAAMYGRPNHVYGEFQRPLCNKCHVKD